MSRLCREEPKEDDGIKTITYDEYVNAGIPDALLQGLGFAESLSKEPEDTEDENDGAKDPAEQPEIPDADISNSGLQPGPSLVASAPVVTAGLITLLSSQIVESVMSRNSSVLLQPSSSAAGNNMISSTPPSLSLVDRHGNILPTLPSIPGLVGNACSSSLIAPSVSGKAASSCAVKYVDQNGRVLTSVPSSSSAADSSRVVCMEVDSDGRIVTGQVPPNRRVIDKDGRVILTGISSLGTSGISKSVAADTGDFKMSLSSGSGSLKRNLHRGGMEETNIPQSW